MATGGTRWIRFVRLACLVAAVGFLGWAAVLAVQANAIQRGATQVTGTVVDVREYHTGTRAGRDDHPTQDITFEYALEGQTLRGVWPNDARTWRTGQREQLLVDPDDPTSPRLASAWGLYRMPIVYAGVAALLVFSSFLVARVSRARERSPRARGRVTRR
jgi:Protein of unknown function (DUF3592)